ncbi:MAG: hypothetical protein WA884_08735, partial [Methyloceanibacter sp.]
MRIAGELGLDTARLERDIQNPSIDGALAETTGLARALGVRGYLSISSATGCWARAPTTFTPSSPRG